MSVNALVDSFAIYLSLHFLQLKTVHSVSSVGSSNLTLFRDYGRYLR